MAMVFPPAVGAMLVWIFIAACWAGLLLLILHDATKDADGRSAVSAASRNALFTAAKGWRRLRKLGPIIRKLLSTYATSAKANPSPNVSPSPNASPSPKASPSEVPAQTSLATIQSQATEPPKQTWWRKDRRAQITPAELELTIAEAVRKNAPGCGSFIGVIVHHKKPKQYRDPNWGVRGVKFGKADRRIVDETLPVSLNNCRKSFAWQILNCGIKPFSDKATRRAFSPRTAVAAITSSLPPSGSTC